jgi:hypothetical protein
MGFVMDERDLQLGNLLAETLAAFDEGRSADVDRLLDSAGDDRLELVEMVELSLTLRGPASPSNEAIEALAMTPAFDARSWPEILTEARHAQGLKRPALVTALAQHLGISSPDGKERLRERYHEIETGQLDPRRISTVVVDALGDILSGLRAVLDATRLNPIGPLSPNVSFMRDGFDDVDGLVVTDMAPPAEQTADERRVDELFGV